MALSARFRSLSRRTLGLALLGGLAHLAVVELLFAWFDLASLGTVPLFVDIGAFVVGAVPAFAYAARGLLGPAAVVCGSLTVSAAATWARYVRPEVTPTPVDPTPFGWYALGWVVVVAIAVLAGGVEYVIRRAVEADRESAA